MTRCPFSAGEEVVHNITGEVMRVVAANPAEVLVDRAAGQSTYRPAELRHRNIICPIINA